MKIRRGFILQELGDDHIAVPVGLAGDHFNGVIQLNETGALLWRVLEKGATEGDLADALLRQYPGADRDQVREDVKEFLETVRMAIDP